MSTPDGEPTIRRAGPDDLARIAVIEQMSFGDPWPLVALRIELDVDARRRPLIVEQNGVVDGYLMAWVVADEYHIVNIAVNPAVRRAGYGSRLLEAGLAEARSAGCVLATLEVRPSNRAAIAFYTDWGLREVGRRPRYYADNGEDALILTCRL